MAKKINAYTVTVVADVVVFATTQAEANERAMLLVGAASSPDHDNVAEQAGYVQRVFCQRTKTTLMPEVNPREDFGLLWNTAEEANALSSWERYRQKTEAGVA